MHPNINKYKNLSKHPLPIHRYTYMCVCVSIRMLMSVCVCQTSLYNDSKTVCLKPEVSILTCANDIAK